MFRYIVVSFLISIANIGYCQNLDVPALAYNQAVSTAEIFVVNGLYDSAVITYQAAFDLHDPIAFDLYNAFIAATETKDTIAAERFTMQLVDKGIGSNFFKKNNNFKRYHSHSNWVQWLQKSDSKKAKIKFLNQELITRLGKISFSANKLYRVWLNSIAEKTISKETDLERQMNEQNNLLIDSLVNVIDQFGYPSEERIGVNIINDTVILSEPIFSRIIQSGYSRPNGIGGGTFDTILKNALDSGFIKPFFYARMHDYKHYKNESPYGTRFFSGLNGKLYYSNWDDINQIETNRRQIGLSPLSQYAKLIEYTKQNQASLFRFCLAFVEQDRLLETEKDKLEFVKNSTVYDSSKIK